MPTSYPLIQNSHSRIFSVILGYSRIFAWPAQFWGKFWGNWPAHEGWGQLPPRIGTKPEETLNRRPRWGQCGNTKFILFWTFHEVIHQIWCCFVYFRSFGDAFWSLSWLAQPKGPTVNPVPSPNVGKRRPARARRKIFDRWFLIRRFFPAQGKTVKILSRARSLRGGP